MKNKRNETGITLIALVVTVIVLIILTGISINMITGENGIISRTKEAREKTEGSSDLEYLQTKAYEAITNYYALGSNEPEMEYVLKSLNSSEIATDVNTGLVTYNGKTYDISDIMGKTSEQKAIASQTNIKLKQITEATATDDDITLFENGKIRMMVEEERDNTNRAVIPNGFYYVTGAPSTGLVVSDKFGDDDNNTKGGNQFVWVPCKGTLGVKYEKTDNADDKYGLASSWTKYNSHAYSYNEYTDWMDYSGNLSSVNTYGGFYVARYEAGVPTNAPFYANKDGQLYIQNKNPSTDQLIEDEEKKLSSDELNRKLIPVSKKENQCWNEITQKNAIKVAKAMYYNNSYVSSNLIDSYAWDTITEWMSNDSKYNTIYGESTYTVGNNSTNFGNYNNNYNIKLSNAFYALHKYGVGEDSRKWTAATEYKEGMFVSGKENVEGYSYDIRKELATGATEETKIKNIYDMAGNMWEWTTEIGNHNKTNTEYGVLRGGSFLNYGNNDTLAGRNGDHFSSNYSDIDIGFRVVLYIK